MSVAAPRRQSRRSQNPQHVLQHRLHTLSSAAESITLQHMYEGNSLFTKVKYHNDVVFDQS